MSDIVSDSGALATLCTRIEQAPRVAIDTEFHNERSYAARLMVVQLAFEDDVVIVDPLAITDLSLLARALGHTTVVGHALSGDLRIFADRFACLPKAAFDTQVAAAFCGYGQSISLLDLVQALVGKRLQKTQTVSDWSMRPLDARQLVYLVEDVAYLFQLADMLAARLEESGRSEWAAAESESLCDMQTYRPDPERLYLRLPGAARMSRRELGVLRELARMRDDAARARDIPTKYIFPDDVVTGLASLRPTSLDELQQLRRLDSAARKSFGAEILRTVARGLALPDEELPERPPRPAPLQRDALISLMSVLVNGIATANDLPASLLAPRAALERVARDLPSSGDALAAALDLSGWRLGLLEEPLLALIAGRVALAIDGGDGQNPRVVTIPRQ